MIFQRLGAFWMHDSTGIGIAFAAQIQHSAPVTPSWVSFGTAGEGVPDVWLVPMDDFTDDWHRLWAEHHCGKAHLGLTVGRPGGCRHLEGTPHPRLGHIMLPGRFVWAHEPHPDVVTHLERTRTMPTADLIHHHGGLARP